ncbi:MAG: V-type ATP synthase subunit E family protein [Candidatus Bathyarchaeota archaeon]
MASIKQGLTAIANEILEDVKLDSEKIVRDAEDKASKILREAKKEAESRRNQLLAETKKKSELEKKKIESLTIIEIRNSHLKVKENQINDVFAKAFERLKKFVESEDYLNWLLLAIEKAVKEFDSNQLIVYLNSKDLKLLKNKNFDQLAKKLRITFSTSTLNNLGGFIIETPDGKLSRDNTFENRLQAIKSDLRNEIAKILFSNGGLNNSN